MSFLDIKSDLLKIAASQEQQTQVRAALQAAIDTWETRIRQYDPTAEFKPSIRENAGGWWGMKRNYAMLNVVSTEPLEMTERDRSDQEGTVSMDDKYFLAIAIYWDDVENKGAVRVEDSFLPDAWQRKGIYAAGLGALLEKAKGLTLEPMLYVHHAREDEPWQALAGKFGLTYKNT